MGIVEADRPLCVAIGEGRSDLGIAQALLVSQTSVEKCGTAIFRKLPIAQAETDHRRIQAVRTYLHAADRRR